MKLFFAASLVAASLLFTSCGSSTVPLAELNESEQVLLSAINRYRASLGKTELQPSADLTQLARKDASRRALSGAGYIDHRQETGYERMLTLAGKARGGPDFGSKLMGVWQKHPIQREWLGGGYAGVGVGTATNATGLQTGVLLLGGFSGGGI